MGSQLNGDDRGLQDFVDPAPHAILLSVLTIEAGTGRIRVQDGKFLEAWRTHSEFGLEDFIKTIWTSQCTTVSTFNLWF